MFRQKIDQLTNCSCRLIPNQSNEYMIFKTQNSHTKPVFKEPKQKFSLKSQISSSIKPQSKVTSAQKTSLKAVRLNQDDKLPKNKNSNSHKQKFQKNLICSPENSQLRKASDPYNQASNFGSQVRSFTKMQNSIKTAQNKAKIQKRQEVNSQSHLNVKGDQNKKYMVSTFSNQTSAINFQQLHKKQEIPKKSLNFQDYSKYVSNPYSMNDRNKENLQGADNPQTSRYKIDLRLKKEIKKNRNQIPLQQMNRNYETQVFHESLQKHESYNDNLRGTFNGSMTTKNSLSSQNQSMKASKNQVSLMNSKAIKIQQNPSLQFGKMYTEPEDNDFMRQNQRQIFFQRNLSSIVTQRHQRQRNNSYLPNIMVTEIPENGKNLLSKMGIKHVVSQIQKPSILKVDKKSEQSQKNKAFDMQKRIDTQKLEIIKCSPVNRKILIDKKNTFSDFINNTSQCESILGEGDKSGFSNEESVVIMRYKDLIEEVQGLTEFDNNFILTSEDLHTDSKIIYKNKDNHFQPDSSKILTSIKPANKYVSNLIQDSTITCNQNMKKTVKYNEKKYFTQQFNLIQ